jgi:hypothetical protein
MLNEIFFKQSSEEMKADVRIPFLTRRAMKAASLPGSNQILNTLPLAYSSFVLSNPILRMHARQRMGLPLISRTVPCKCGNLIDNLCTHVFRHGATKRHDRVVKTVLECAKEAGLVARTEVPHLLRGEDGHIDERVPADLLLENFRDGCDLCIDFTGVDALDATSGYAGPHDRDWFALKPVEVATNAKNAKYNADCRAQGLRFMPFVFTSFGGLGEEALDLVRKIADALASKTGRTKEECRAEIKARIAFSILKSQYYTLMELVQEKDLLLF